MAIGIRYHGGLSHADTLRHLQAFSAIFIFWAVVYFAHRLFEIETLRYVRQYVVHMTVATVLNLLVAVVYFYAQPNLILTPRRFLLLVVAISFTLTGLWGLVVRYLMKHALMQGVYIMRIDEDVDMLERELRESSHLGIRYLGRIEEAALPSLVGRLGPGTGIVLPKNIPDRPQTLLQLFALRHKGVVFYNHRRIYEQLFRKVYIQDITEAWFLENVQYGARRLYGLVKRLVDVCFGLLTAGFFVVSFPLIALLVKLSSPGSVFFTQERVGENGLTFTIYKYRTMDGTKTHGWTAPQDPRITRIGRFLRRTRLDELPQCINILQGNMSLVGPRPEQVHIVRDLHNDIPFFNERHMVKPGLTGWAQLHIYASSVEHTKQKLAYDLYYIKHRSLWFDAEIILKTFYHMLASRGR